MKVHKFKIDGVHVQHRDISDGQIIEKHAISSYGQLKSKSMASLSRQSALAA